MIVIYNSNLFIVQATGKGELEAISGSKKLHVITDKITIIKESEGQ
jgi:hypothetical protein